MINAIKKEFYYSIQVIFNVAVDLEESHLQKKSKINIDDIVQASRRKQAGLQTFFLMKQIVSFILWKYNVPQLQIQIKQQKMQEENILLYGIILANHFFYIYTL